jgi:hypothetical protein
VVWVAHSAPRIRVDRGFRFHDQRALVCFRFLRA